MELREIFFSIPVLFFLLLSFGVLLRLWRTAFADIASDGLSIDTLCAVDIGTVTSFNEHTCLTSCNFPSKWVLNNVCTMLTTATPQAGMLVILAQNLGYGLMGCAEFRRGNCSGKTSKNVSYKYTP